MLIAERVEHVNRIKGLLFAQGVRRLRATTPRPAQAARRTADWRWPSLAGLSQGAVNRELDRLEMLLGQIKTVEAERDALMAAEKQTTSPPTPASMLLNIKGIGAEFAAVLWSEGLFRHFDNRRQIAAYAGLAPSPWQSGSVDREQGVSKAGNPRLRTTLIQLAWLWLRHQPKLGAHPLVRGTRQAEAAACGRRQSSRWRESC